MKLSKRGQYALRALMVLGVAHELGRPLLPLSGLAAKEQRDVTPLDSSAEEIHPISETAAPHTSQK